MDLGKAKNYIHFGRLIHDVINPRNFVRSHKKIMDDNEIVPVKTKPYFRRLKWNSAAQSSCRNVINEMLKVGFEP